MKLSVPKRMGQKNNSSRWGVGNVPAKRIGVVQDFAVYVVLQHAAIVMNTHKSLQANEYINEHEGGVSVRHLCMTTYLSGADPDS